MPIEENRIDLTGDAPPVLLTSPSSHTSLISSTPKKSELSK